MSGADVLAIILIVAGLFGIVIPVLPGLILVVAGALAWAVGVGTPAGWAVFAVCCLIAVAGYVAQYAIPGRRLQRGGLSRSTILIGLGCGVVGFFVIPFLGAVVGFVGGIFVVELLARQELAGAWRATTAALIAVAQSIGIELVAALTIAGTLVGATVVLP